MYRKPLLYRKITLILFFINGLFFLFGIALMSLGVYAIIDNGNVSELVGTTLYTSGVYILIFFGIIIVFLAICGVVASKKENRCMIVTYSAILCVSILFMFISGIMVLVFKNSLGEAAKSVMLSTLRNQYGRYKIITDAWNFTQTYLRCCAVDDSGWQAYSDSWWDTFINKDIYESNAKISATSPFYKFVPESCCATIIDGLTGWPSATYRDLLRCQNWQYGPPYHLGGPHNDAIYYGVNLHHSFIDRFQKGCFNSLKSYIGNYGKAMGALAIIVVVILIVALVTSIMLLLSTKRSSGWSQRSQSQHPYASMSQ
ncbi:Tetraspanin [Fasciolopsis buskii]|uniref:Tetraspanin n=1 Tax=Fasciolopsis buskii TaxID=27845 RepID=A0A8E0VF10_9TREM|nr:Tetraspanin [Fasciolopsis buski]